MTYVIFIWHTTREQQKEHFLQTFTRLKDEFTRTFPVSEIGLDELSQIFDLGHFVVDNLYITIIGHLPSSNPTDGELFDAMRQQHADLVAARLLPGHVKGATR